MRDSIPKVMGNFLVKEIQENMQLKLYNKLYNAREMTDLLSEPESVAERRKELNDMIKVMRNAQKITNTNTNTTDNKKKEEPKKPIEKKESKPVQEKEKEKEKEKPKATGPALKPPAEGGKKKNFGNLFG